MKIKERTPKVKGATRTFGIMIVKTSAAVFLDSVHKLINDLTGIVLLVS